MTGEVALPALAPSGALPAVIDLPEGPRPDETSFVTALGLRALGHRSGAAATLCRARMLDFLGRCRQPSGAFAFWPGDARPAWGGRVPPDADDTALCLIELFRAGRTGRAEAVRSVARLILPNRVRHDGTPRPSWIPAGAFATWLVPETGGRNIVDCAVNANILALLALLGMNAAPGRTEAAHMIGAGLDWAGPDPRRLRALTPFYPEPAEFRLALDHAVACGAVELVPAATRLRALAGSDPPAAGATICSGAYASRGWRSPALARLRHGAAVQKECV